MSDSTDHSHVTKIEAVFVLGFVGCLLLATWELGHLMADNWFGEWVLTDRFTRERVIRYGIAFFMAIVAVVLATWLTPKASRFGATIVRAFLWYGVLLLISTICIFIFDCLPEVFAGIVGACMFGAAIYILQRRYFTKERLATIRLSKGKCPSCAAPLRGDAGFCAGCGRVVGGQCPKCQSFTRVLDRHCSHCGEALDR